MSPDKNYSELIDEVESRGRSAVDRLTHGELLRAQALSQACSYYINTIVKDGELYREMMREGRVLKPATYIGVIETAISFEAYLKGDLKRTIDAIALKKTLQELDAEMGEIEDEADKNENAIDDVDIDADGPASDV